jgi:hypothetical protein
MDVPSVLSTPNFVSFSGSLSPIFDFPLLTPFKPPIYQYSPHLMSERRQWSSEEYREKVLPGIARRTPQSFLTHTVAVRDKSTVTRLYIVLLLQKK